MKSTLGFVLLSSFLLLVGCSQKNPKPGPAYDKAAMKSYKVKGKRYYPKTVKLGESTQGIASWYGPKFHGRTTSNGERYNMHAHTAAHKTWPMHTRVKVTNLNNGKSTIVRINDRGPFVSGRIIDCSYAAGRKLGLHKSGVANVKLEVVGPKHLAKMDTQQTQTLERATTLAQSSSNMQPILSDIKKPTQENTTTTQFKSSPYKLQLGAFSNYSSAKNAQQSYAKLFDKYNPIIQSTNSNGITLYKVLLEGFENKETLLAFKEQYNLNHARVTTN